ncbi:MAG: hypothetical protein K2X66_14835, partial [Cyanobacteria bacterium]|nr:hypothetical protein [Cyanobacteriota bacterium]
LIARIQKKDAPLTGHMFMLLKHGGDPNIYLYDINSKVPIPVPMENLQETLNHPKSRAIIPQRVPPTIPPHLQGGLTVNLPV